MKLTVAIEGLNRVGKDTQLDLSVDRYSKEGFKVLYMRGSGSRSGLGTKTFHDPESEYRKLLQKKLYEEEINTAKSDLLWLKATGRLQREINHLSKIHDPDILFLNRNIITNHFMFKQQDANITFSETINRIRNVSWGIGPIFADLTIILHTQNLDLFLERAKKTDDDGFRERLLRKHFSLYNQTLCDLDAHGFPYVLVEADQTIEDINKSITKQIDLTIENKK